MFRSRTIRAAAALVIVATLSLAPAAYAGCLTEFKFCGDCATKHMYNAMRELDFGGMADAQLEGWDCEIDLFHCVMYAHHHDYTCDV